MTFIQANDLEWVEVAEGSVLQGTDGRNDNLRRIAHVRCAVGKMDFLGKMKVGYPQA